MESLELKEVVAFTQPDFKEDKKRRKRLELGRILVLIFLIMIAISLIRKVDFSSYLNLREEKSIVKPIPDFLIKDSEGELEEKLKKLNLKPVRILFLDKKDIKILLPNGIEVFLTSEKDLDPQLTSLHLIINRFKIEGRGVKKIDLRFKNPIIE